MEGRDEQRSAATDVAATAAPAAAPKRAAAPSTSFKGCRPALSQEVLETVKEMGFESMTPVQVRADTQPMDTAVKDYNTPLLSFLVDWPAAEQPLALGSGERASWVHGTAVVFVYAGGSEQQGVSCEQ